MKQQGKRLVIATSASQEDLKGLLEQTGLQGLVDDSTTSSDADRSKPNPDILQAALKKIHLDKADVVMLGDTPYDVEAANRAGIKAIGLTCGGWSQEALTKAGAISVYKSPQDLLTALKTGDLSLASP